MAIIILKCKLNRLNELCLCENHCINENTLFQKSVVNARGIWVGIQSSGSSIDWEQMLTKPKNEGM